MTGPADDTMPTGTMSSAPQVLLAHHLKNRSHTAKAAGDYLLSISWSAMSVSRFSMP